MAKHIHAGFDILALRGNTRNADFKTAPQYFYRYLKLAAGATAALPDWRRLIMFVPTPGQDMAQVGYDNFVLAAGDTLALYSQGGSITAITNATILLAGTNVETESCAADPVHKTYQDHYKVAKPWGHELWLNGEDPVFNFKEVHLKQGHQTSLQYHNFKQETNFLFAGESDLVFKANAAVQNNDVTDADLGVLRLRPRTVMYIEPPSLHRLIAITDLYLYEAATAYLDDVFRVQDDAARGHGRIAAEHLKAG